MRASSAGFGPERRFAPVIINGDCRGHILRSAKGFRTFDRDDREIGTYPTPDAAVAALLELAAASAARTLQNVARNVARD